VEYVDMGVVNLKGEPDHFSVLNRILREVSAIIDKYSPDEMAIEAPFYGKNPQVMLKLGRAQGSAIASANLKNIPITEYPPRTVKLAVTGKGSASKIQVSSMVHSLLNIETQEKYLDSTDALAIALCHFYHIQKTNYGCSRKNSSSWENFIKDNPSRVK
jgi:crossover junction endodeoxyribonuclease RuvC